MYVFVKDWRQGLEPFDPETEGKRSNTLMATRVLPTEFLDRVSDPLTLTEGNRAWEQQRPEGWAGLPGHDKDIAGTWVSPPLTPSLRTPDLNTVAGRPMSLVGIAGRKIMDSPDWHAKRANYEGFKYDGFDENKYRLLSQGFPGAQNTTLEDLQRAAMYIDYPHLFDDETNESMRGLVNALRTAQFESGNFADDVHFADTHWAPSVTELPHYARTDYPPILASEPMDLAWRLLKLELAPPMTQGVEEQVPMQEDIPMVDMTMGDYESPCECAERIRSDVLGLILQEIEKPTSSQSDIDSLREQHQKWQGHECQEILQWAETTNGFNPTHYCNNNNMSEADQMKYTGEPMDLAMRLLKMPLLPESVRDAGVDKYGINEYTADFEHPETGEIYPMQGYVDRDEAGTFIYPPNIKPPKESPPTAGDGHPLAGAIGEAVFMPPVDHPNPQEKEWTGSPYIRERDPFAEGNEFGEESLPVGMGTAMYDLAAIMADKRHGAKIVPSANRSHQAHNMWAKHEDKGYWPVKTGEPMEIGDVLVKDRISPEAKQHKLEYDKKYESSPERVKYREELNRERRKRGMYGDHSHRDISHTEGNKLTVEDEHSNRSRHFKDKGTLRSDTKKAGIAVKQPKPNDHKPIGVKEVGDYYA